MNRRIAGRIPQIAFVLLCAASLMSAGPQKNPSALAADKGKFRVLINGQEVGTEDFQITATGDGWATRGKITVQLPGGTATEVEGKLRLRADGSLVAYDWMVQGEKKVGGTLVMSAATAKFELQREGATPFTQELTFDSPRVVVLDHNMYHHYSILTSLYDWQKKGAQTFSAVIPQDLVPGSITLEWFGKQEGRDMLRLRSSDLEMELQVLNGRLMRLSVPISNVVVERQ